MNEDRSTVLANLRVLESSSAQTLDTRVSAVTNQTSPHLLLTRSTALTPLPGHTSPGVVPQPDRAGRAPVSHVHRADALPVLAGAAPHDRGSTQHCVHLLESERVIVHQTTTAQSHDSSDFEVSFRPAISSTDRFFEWSPSGNTAIQQGGFLQIKMKRIF